MPFENLERHVTELGGLKSNNGGLLRPFDDAQLREVSALVGKPLPAALRWWWSRYGGAMEFVEPVVYTDPLEHVEMRLGWFLDADQLRKTFDDFASAMHPNRVPVIEDDFGNLIVVDSDGSVYEHIHDAPLDRNENRIANSFEAFVRMLRKGD